MTAQSAWLWLREVLGPGSRGLKEILELYQTPAAFYEAVGREDISGLLTPAQAARLEVSEAYLASLQAACRRSGVQILCYDDPAYPQRLRNIPDPPCVLFCTGSLTALQQTPAVGMIGSRRPSAYGVEAAAAISAALASAGVCLISGLADGLDSEAHKAAVQADAPTVGVLGTAIDKTYPASNAALRRQMENAAGAVISEYAPGQRTGAGCFLQRNRLIAALCTTLCVVEARQQSGTMNTVGHAESYGRPVYAVPGGIFSQVCSGTNLLLAQGRAKAIAGADTLLGELGLETAAPAHKKQTVTMPLSCEAKAVQPQLNAAPSSLEILAGGAGLEVGPALAALLELEMAGIAESCAGGMYKRK